MTSRSSLVRELEELHCDRPGCAKPVGHIEGFRDRFRGWCVTDTPWSGHGEHCPEPCSQLVERYSLAKRVLRKGERVVGKSDGGFPSFAGKRGTVTLVRGARLGKLAVVRVRLDPPAATSSVTTLASRWQRLVSEEEPIVSTPEGKLAANCYGAFMKGFKNGAAVNAMDTDILAKSSLDAIRMAYEAGYLAGSRARRAAAIEATSTYGYAPTILRVQSEAS